MATPEQNHLVPGGLGAVAAHDRAVRVLYDSSHVAVGEFHCWPDDPRWKEENCTWEGHFVVFPGTTVKIAQAGRKHPVVTTLNDVLFYNRDQAYRRAMVSRRGDHCTFLLVSPALLEDVARESVPDLIDPLDRPFPGAHAPTDAPTFMLERLVVQRVRAGVAHDGLRIQECLYEVVGRAIRSLFRFRALRTDAGRPATRDQHAEMVEQAKTLLASALAEPLSLEEIGRRLYVSPYHLARVFRAQTGFALHEYRDHLRVRASVDRMGDSAQPITDVATSVGYASPSHFTDAFRRRFGFAPSTARRWARAGQLDQPRRRLS